MNWMYQNGPMWSHDYGMGLWGLGLGLGLGLLPVILVWSLAWKGWALWLAARRGEFVWFLIMLVVNTLGILEIIYIFMVAKREDTTKHHKETT
jgi:methionyl-tRNA synthetase